MTKRSGEVDLGAQFASSPSRISPLSGRQALAVRKVKSLGRTQFDSGI